MTSVIIYCSSTVNGSSRQFLGADASADSNRDMSLANFSPGDGQYFPEANADGQLGTLTNAERYFAMLMILVGERLEPFPTDFGADT